MASGITDEMFIKFFHDLKQTVIDKPPANLKYKGMIILLKFYR